MKKLFAAAALAAGLAFAPANAAVIDFANDADTNGERGVAASTDVIVDGFSLNLQTLGGNPYFDAGNAGLGVCQNLDTNDQCDPSSDDSIQEVNGIAEAVGIFFNDGPVTITDLSFTDFNHNAINMGNDGEVILYINSGSPTGTFMFSELVALAAGGDALFTNVNFIGFQFVDLAFYVSSITVSDVPIPGAIPLLISGLAGLGFASKKKKKTA